MAWSRTEGDALKARAARVIPGGMYGHESVRLLPESYPQFLVRGDGAHVWDADGNEYVDFLCAYGPNLFGYRHPRVEAAVRAQLDAGDTLTGPTPVMVELAERFVGQVAHAEWAMFCKNGTDATTMALMIARAATGRRQVVLVRGAYHGAQPWCTPVPVGVTAEDRAHQHRCDYNDVEGLEAAVRAAGDDLAAILVSPFRHDGFVDQEMPTREWARRCRAACDRTGALLVMDDVRAGFRLARDGSWSTLGVEPDLSAWGKAIANGHPLSALVGNERARAAASRVYTTGSFWFSAAPMAAALATLELIATTDYLEHIVAIGTALRDGLAASATRHGFRLRQTGPVQMPQILFADDPDVRLGFCWTEEMLHRGVYLHPWHNMFVCAAHSPADVEFTVTQAERAFAAVARRRASLGPVAQLAWRTSAPR